MSNAINSAPIIKDGDYYTAVRRGVQYCAKFEPSVGQWFVATHRLALGRFNSGGGRYYADISQCKAFAALPALMNMGAM